MPYYIKVACRCLTACQTVQDKNREEEGVDEKKKNNKKYCVSWWVLQCILVLLHNMALDWRGMWCICYHPLMNHQLTRVMRGTHLSFIPTSPCRELFCGEALPVCFVQRLSDPTQVTGHTASAHCLTLFRGGWTVLWRYRRDNSGKCQESCGPPAQVSSCFSEITLNKSPDESAKLP